jgi:hypothetical protein
MQAGGVSACMLAGGVQQRVFSAPEFAEVAALVVGEYVDAGFFCQ